MFQIQFKKGKQYYHLRNYKNQSLFHIAAKNNSLDALQLVVERQAFFEELLVKDFWGNTPLHTAASNGSYDVLEFFLTNCTAKFIEIQNDSG